MDFSAWALLGLLSNFCCGPSQKRRFWIVTRSRSAGKTGRRCTKNPVAGRARQVVTIRNAVSVWNCTCSKKRSLEAGGRYSRWSLKAGFTVVYLLAVRARGSLVPIVPALFSALFGIMSTRALYPFSRALYQFFTSTIGNFWARQYYALFRSGRSDLISKSMTPFGRACVVSKCIQGKFETAPTRQHHSTHLD